MAIMVWKIGPGSSDGIVHGGTGGKVRGRVHKRADHHRASCGGHDHGGAVAGRAHGKDDGSENKGGAAGKKT